MSEEKYQDSRARGPHQDSRANVPQDSRIRVTGHTRDEIKGMVKEVLLEGDFRGEPGKDSVVPGPKVELAVGRVVAGEFASATLRDEGDAQVLDLVLPRGPQGEASRVPGPAGSPGAAGATGAARHGKDAPSLAEIKSTIVEVLRSDDMRQNYRGERGERGDSITGPAGKDASLEDIRKVVVELLSSQEIRDQYRGERGRDGVDGAEGPVGRSAGKEFVQDIVLGILKRNNLIR